jgi:hypothetical protein
MSDGRFNAANASESIQQAGLSRHRLLTVELGTGQVTNPPPAAVASYRAFQNPNLIPEPNAANPNPTGGPHFVMSAETPDNAHTFGMEFAIINSNNFSVAAPVLATPLTGGFTVTVWCLITVTQDPAGVGVPVWASLLPQTGVQFNELYRTFDINAQAIRFQIENGSSSGGANTGAVTIAMCEL